MTSSQHIADQVNKYNTQETLKKFLDPNYTYIPYDKKYKLNIKIAFGEKAL